MQEREKIIYFANFETGVKVQFCELHIIVFLCEISPLDSSKKSCSAIIMYCVANNCVYLCVVWSLYAAETQKQIDSIMAGLPDTESDDDKGTHKSL